MRSGDEAHGAREPAHGHFEIPLKCGFDLSMSFDFRVGLAHSGVSCRWVNEKSGGRQTISGQGTFQMMNQCECLILQ